MARTRLEIDQVDGLQDALDTLSASRGSDAMVWYSAWVTATGYLANDCVRNGGSAYVCTLAHTSGAATEPGVGVSWATRWELIAADGQPLDATLTALAALATGADKLAYSTGSDTFAQTDLSAFARTILDDANAGAVQSTLGLVIGTNVQAFDATLAALAALTIAANSLTIGTGADAFAQTAFAANTFPARASTGDLVAKAITDFGLSLVDDADAATARTTLGLVIGTNVQAYDAELAALAGLTSAANKLPYFTGSGTAGLADFTPAGFSLTLSANATVGGTHSGTSSGTNTGDQTSIVGISGTIAQFNTACSDADFATGGGTATGTNTGDQTTVSGNAGTVTVADAGGDTTTWVLLGTAQTGSLAPATDAGLTYNATTNALTAASFVGALTGNADTVTTNANLTGPITSTGNATAVAAQTGTGSTFAMQTGPVFTTTITVGAAGGATGEILLKGVTSGTVTLKTAAAAGTWTMTLPANDGDSGQFLRTDGAGVCTWAAATAAPGGSDTQVQFNDGGVLAGDAALVWDKTNNRLGVGGSSTATLHVENAASGANIFRVDGAGGTNLQVYYVGTDPIVVMTAGVVQFTLNSVAATCNFDFYNGVANFGDLSNNGNGTLFTVDDTNSRIVAKAPKVVIEDGTSSALYMYDSGTSTYWKWESISGVWTGTDTTSASLP